MRKKFKQNELRRSLQKFLTVMFCMFISSFFCLSANAQNITVVGSVENTSGEPVPGTTVVVKGTTQGTVTGSGGNYSLSNVPADATLVFSFVGMKTVEIPIKGETKIDVVMEEETI